MNASRFSGIERDAALSLIRTALAEDLGDAVDVTTTALIAETDHATVDVVARENGIVCGLPAADLVFQELDARVCWKSRLNDGDSVEPGTIAASVEGPLRSLLTGERTALNFITHLSGVASLTRRFTDAVAGTSVDILDTRKTLPGYRLLQKYAVRCGGGTNHRMGLFDAILIKDNHLAAWSTPGGDASIAAAIEAARKFISENSAVRTVEVEVDTLEQLAVVLPAVPDIVLLDNMGIDELRRAVAMRNDESPTVRLEASGGITLENVRVIAECGVDRISIGALTHSARALDFGFDWREATKVTS